MRADSGAVAVARARLGSGRASRPCPRVTRKENIMETVKVDTQKLQLLNERIVQALDALNLLRLSAHGIQAIQQPWAQNVFGYGGYGTFSPWGVYNPFAFAPPTFAPVAGYPGAYPGVYPTNLGGYPGVYGTPTNLGAYPGVYGTPIPHASTQPIAWPSPLWGSAGVSNGAPHSSWRPEWQTRSQHGWPFASAE
jgi:hypothetical protein